MNPKKEIQTVISEKTVYEKGWKEEELKIIEKIITKNQNLAAVKWM